jgi:two-component system response regulator NreC
MRPAIRESRSNQVNTAAVINISPRAPEPLEASLVLAYAGKLPAQLEHWIKKHGMRLENAPLDSTDTLYTDAKRARFLLVDVDVLGQERSPVDLVRRLRGEAPQAGIIVISHRSDETFVRSMTEAGASGLVTKHPYVADLALALAALAEGKAYVSGHGKVGAGVTLSDREAQVLDLMAAGHTNQVIGGRLAISVKTVEAHRARIFQKLAASNVADAVRLAIRAGLVIP